MTRPAHSFSGMNRTGEVRVRHGLFQRPVVLNNRRKDASRRLTTLLNALARQRA
jgi:hypothetical protein